MKYIVITSKHHDGFGMFRSDLTDWCIKSTPFQRDPLKELAEACRKQASSFASTTRSWTGTIPTGAPAAPGTTWPPSTPPDMDRYTPYMKGQLKELLTSYGPMGILWFDGEWEAPWTHERGVDLYQYVRSLQPGIIVNNRVGKARAGMSGMDKGASGRRLRHARAGNPADRFGPGVDWESCMTMNNHWGYNKDDQNWKSPHAHPQSDRLRQQGRQLSFERRADHRGPDSRAERRAAGGDRQMDEGQRRGHLRRPGQPVHKAAFGKCTQKPGKLYLHVFDWPKDGSW